MQVNPHSLKPNPWNSNKVSRPEFEKLKKSLTKHGAFKPVTVRELEDGTLEILGGFHRVEAAKELGWENIPVFNIGKIDDAKAKEIGLIDNTRYGEDDKELLDKIMSELEDLAEFTDLIPEQELIDMVPGDTLEAEIEKALEEAAREEQKDEDHKTLRFKLDIDKAEEIEAVLSKIAFDNDYTYSDGYSNFSEALYHALVIDR